MENATAHSAGAEEGTQTAAALPELQSIAHSLAAKHGNGSAEKRRGGRRTASEEAAEYLSRHNLRAVPVDSAGHSDGPASGGENGAASFEPAYVVTPDFVKTCADTLLKGIEAYRKRQVFLTVQKLDPSLASQFADEATAPPGAIEVMSLCCAEISQKYDWLANCGPEAILCAAAGTWLFKDVALHKKLNELGAIKAKADAPK